MRPGAARRATTDGAARGWGGHGPPARLGRLSARRSRLAAPAAVAAAALGVGHALVSAYWALGGTALLDTIGGDLERWGRERRPALVAGLWAVVVVKLVVALAAPVLAGLGAQVVPAWARGRVPRLLGWVAAGVLTLWGGLLTGAGLLVESGAIEPTADADHTALAWHAYVWDPWFLVWGVMFSVSLWLTRPGAGPAVSRPRRPRP